MSCQGQSEAVDTAKRKIKVLPPYVKRNTARKWYGIIDWRELITDQRVTPKVTKKTDKETIGELVNLGDQDAEARAEIDTLLQVRRLQRIAAYLATRIEQGDPVTRAEHDNLQLEKAIRLALLDKTLPNIASLSLNKGKSEAITTGTVVLPSLASVDGTPDKSNTALGKQGKK